jgi:signal transduction histidine kinase
VVTNAIDACERALDGRVAVATEYIADKALARVTVEDNGEGIAPDDIHKVFSLFESRKGSRGTGLGLPVSQKILREHGGEIRVESVPNAGSKFHLEFPAVSPKEAAAAEVSAQDISPGAMTVEFETEMQGDVTETLHRHGEAN